MKKTRKTNTKAEIIEAFVELINEKGLQTINVTDITRKAGIGRGTFYTHYTGIENLLQKIELSLLDKLSDDLAEVTPDAMKWIIDDNYIQSPNDFISNTLKNFSVNRKLIATLLSENGDPYFIGKVKKLILKGLDASLEQFDVKVKVVDGIPEEYARAYVINELMGIIVYWVTKEDPDPVNDVTEIIVKLQNVAPIKVFKLDDKENENE